MEGIAVIFMMAFAAQVIVERMKELLPAHPQVLAWTKLIVGVALALIFKLDLFALSGYPAEYTVASYVLTGVLISGGSGVLNDFLKGAQAWKYTMQAKVAAETLETASKVAAPAEAEVK